VSAPALQVLVLAGSRGGQDPVAVAAGVTEKALAPVSGRPMLLRVIDALRAVPELGRIWVAAPDHAAFLQLGEIAGLAGSGELRLTGTGEGPADSVLVALEGGLAPPFLVATADSPLLTPDIVAEFLAGARASGADIAVGLAGEAVIRTAYPDTQRTYLKFRDGGVSGCNLFYVASPQGLAAIRFWRRAQRERKKPWRLVRAFGVWSLLLFLTRRLGLDAAMRRAGAVIGCRAAAVRIGTAEAAIDVDKPQDLVLVERILAERQKATTS
jgi:GTP:adenosylcobinamide-phosphate guanylyltransferase